MGKCADINKIQAAKNLESRYTSGHDNEPNSNIRIFEIDSLQGQ
jgi:hypothetical protein